MFNLEKLSPSNLIELIRIQESSLRGHVNLPFLGLTQDDQITSIGKNSQESYLP